MKTERILILLLLPLLLVGCSGLQQYRAAPVVEANSRTDAPAVSSSSSLAGVQISAYEPEAPVKPAPVHGRAVTSLLATAEQQQAAGDHLAAVATIERALRIEPRNAYLWHRLANLRLIQGQLVMASDLAEKSSALAGADGRLKRDNWLLIAKARRRSGDLQGASAAEQKARSVF